MPDHFNKLEDAWRSFVQRAGISPDLPAVKDVFFVGALGALHVLTRDTDDDVIDHIEALSEEISAYNRGRIV